MGPYEYADIHEGKEVKPMPPENPVPDEDEDEEPIGHINPTHPDRPKFWFAPCRGITLKECPKTLDRG